MWGLLWATFGGAHADVGALLLRGTATAAVELVIVIVIGHLSGRGGKSAHAQSCFFGQQGHLRRPLWRKSL